MKLKQFTFLLIASIGISLTGKAQFDYKAQFITKALKTAKTICIVTNDIDPNMDKANAQLDEAVKKYWTATKPEFTNAKYSEIKNKKSAEIYFGIVRTINNGLYENKGPEWQAIYTLTFLTCEKGDKPKMDVIHPRIYLYKDFDELDIIYAVRLLNSYAEASIKGKYDNNLRVSTEMAPPLYRLSELNSGKLKNKILLLDKARIDKKLDEAAIKSIYPNKFKLVSHQEILDAVKSNDPQVAYFHSGIFFEDHTRAMMAAPLIIDAETGNMLSYSKVTSVMMIDTKNPKSFNPDPAVVTKGNLKGIVKNGE